MKLRNKLPLAIGWTSLVITLIVSVFMIHEIKQHETLRLHQKIRHYNELIKLTSLEPLWDVDSEKLQVNLIAFFKDPEVYEVDLHDRTGFIKARLARGVGIRDNEKIKHTLKIEKDQIELGEITITYSKTILNQRIRAITAGFVVLGLIVMLINIMVIYGISIMLLQPIDATVQALKKVDEGDFDTVLDLHTRDEFHEIEVYFNKMTRTINAEIAAREKHEKALQESEERFRRLAENARDIVYRMSLPDGQFEYISPAATALWGYEPKALYNQPELYRDIVHIDWKHTVQQLWKAPDPTPFLEYPIVHAHGEIRWMHQRNVFVSDQQGTPVALEAIVSDITQQKKFQEELELEKEYLSVTLKSIADAVITIDMDAHVRLMNKTAEQLTGFTNAEARDRPITDIYRLSPDGQSAGEHPVIYALAAETFPEPTEQWQLEDGNGKTRPISHSIAPIKNTEQAMIGAVLVFRDMSYWLEMEEERAKRQKLESLGVLAGGIAHDFNNVLTAIIGNIAIAQMNLNMPDSDEAETHQLLKAAVSGAEQAAHLTRQLLTFSKGGEPVFENANIAEVIRDSAGFVLRGSSVQATFDFEPELAQVRIDKGQISQVIQNIVLNAAQAMPDGGLITIRAANEHVMESDEGSLMFGNYIKIDIRDTGPGIPEEHLQRIFDPYFTTKETGNGLGLAICHSIIARHHGSIGVESGKGTCFHLQIPAMIDVAPNQPGPSCSFVKGRGRVLFVDDQEMIRAVTSHILHSLGYTSMSVADGREALECYRAAYAGGAPFDVVITDLTIPGGMGGRELMRELRAFDSNVIGIVSSGYSNDPVMAHYEKYGFKGVITKPYTLAKFSRVLNEVVQRYIEASPA